MGIVFVVLGMLAIIEPAVAGLAVAIFVGWVLIFGGVAHAVGAVGGGGIGRIVWQLIIAVIYVVGGMYFLTHPLLGLGTLTLFLAAILLAEAVVEIIAYFANRDDGGSWRLVNAIVTLLLGGMIWRTLAIELHLGDRNARRREPHDYGILPDHARERRTKARGRLGRATPRRMGTHAGGKVVAHLPDTDVLSGKST